MLDKTDTRCRGLNWTIKGRDDERASFDGAQLAVLMDIREELQAIRRRLECSSTLQIPRYLADIRSNTTKRKRKKSAPR